MSDNDFVKLCTAHIEDTEFEYKEQLDSQNDVLSFIDRELAFWEGFEESYIAFKLIIEHYRLRKFEIEQFILQANNYEEDLFTHKWSELRNKIEATQTDTPVRGQPRQHKRFRILYSKTPEAQYLKSVQNRSAAESVHTYKFLTNTDIEPGSNRTQLSGYFGAYLYTHPYDVQLQERQTAELAALNVIRTEWQQSNETIKKDTANLIEEHADWRSERIQEYESYITTKDTTLQKLEGLYKEKLRLEAPVKEWEVRAEQLHRAGLGWILTLATTCISIILGLVIMLYNLPAAFSNDILSGDPFAIKGFLLTITAVSFAVFLVRLFSKFAISAFHLQRDAEERLKLTYVYLGLVKDQTITPEDRKFFLESIFSRADSGLLKHDSAPEMPGTASILERLTK